MGEVVAGVAGLPPAAVSEELAALGPYFAAEFYGAAAGVPGSGVPASGVGEAAGTKVELSSLPSPWRPMRELVADSGAFAERVAGVRAFLAANTGQDASAVELRVAASVVHLGLVARVVSPLLAVAVLHQRCGLVRTADLWWQPTLGSLFPLAVRAAALDAALDAGTGFAEGVLGGAVAEFSAAAGEFGVNQHILRGNIASALGGACRSLPAAHALVTDLLAGPYLAGAGGYAPDGAFRRRTCCLIYRAAPDRNGALCGDCVLAPERGAMEA